MTPAVVVDIGNSRMKWGRVEDGRITTVIALPLDNSVAWKQTLESWPSTGTWILSGVVPVAVTRMIDWLSQRAIENVVIDNARLLRYSKPFRTVVDEPAAIGIDRLASAFAAAKLTSRPHSTVAISVGTAMTVDFVEPDGTHRGGAILPGPRLMAKSLHDHTAKLPLVDFPAIAPSCVWGSNTTDAIELGIASALLGAADQLVWDWAARSAKPEVFVTGGDAALFADFEFTAEVADLHIAPKLTLEGIRLVAEAMP